MAQYKRPVRPGGSRPASEQRPAVPVRRVAPAGAPAGQNRPAAPSGTARPAQPVRPAAPQYRPRRSVRLPYDFGWLVGISIAVLALGVAAHLLWPNGLSVNPDKGAVAASSTVSEIHGSGPIRINELMSSNDSTAVDDNGLTADWIEVANVSDRAVNLSGYTLGKNERASNVFTFPDHTLQPGECAIVYADSTLQQETGRAYHAPFRLSSQGGALMLFNPSGTAVDSVNFPAMTADMAYVRQDQAAWSVSSMATPGMANTAESYTALHQPRTDAGVEITEIVSSNSRYAPDENGEFHDYFELHNATGAAIDLSGWFVSDAVGQPTKWRLPEGFVLQADEYRIVYASGLNRRDADHPHASFSLSTEGESVLLSDAKGQVADRVDFDLMKPDTSWSKGADGAWSTAEPTPGAAN